MKVIVSRTHKKVVTMRLDDNGVLQVVANNKLPLSKVKELVENQRDWINEQIKLSLYRKNNDHHSSARETCAVYAANQNEEPLHKSSRNAKSAHRPRATRCEKTYDDAPLTSTQNRYYSEMFSGRQCLLCGRLHKVLSTAESKCHLDANCIYIPQRFYSDKNTRVKTLKNYVKKLSMQNISTQISKFGSHASLCPTRIEFKNLPTGQWIKCTTPTERIIALDYRICQLPPNLQHYLIVHAFSHFSNSTHDDDFWNMVSNYLPYYKDCLEELQQYDFLKDI